MIREAIAAIVDGRSLSQEEAAGAMRDVMAGEATPAQVGAFVTALRMKGETPEEIAGMARVMREKALKVDVAGPLVDTCGTGGDGAGTFNISTAAAFVVAAAGLKVAKHGNRAASGVCGSADILEALGVKIALGPQGVRQCLEQVGIGFMFAPVFHPAMKHAAGPRREIGIRTVFNILGPLTNPAGAQAQVLGVADRALGPKMAQVLSLLGVKRAAVVHGEDGLDEVTLSTRTQVWEVQRDGVREYTIQPEDFGLTSGPMDAIRCRAPQEHAALFKSVLKGEQGPAQDVVVLNAAAALMAGGKVGSLGDGVALARQVASSGAALEKLNHLASFSQGLT